MFQLDTPFTKVLELKCELFKTTFLVTLDSTMRIQTQSILVMKLYNATFPNSFIIIYNTKHLTTQIMYCENIKKDKDLSENTNDSFP